MASIGAWAPHVPAPGGLSLGLVALFDARRQEVTQSVIEGFAPRSGASGAGSNLQRENAGFTCSLSSANAVRASFPTDSNIDTRSLPASGSFPEQAWLTYRQNHLAVSVDLHLPRGALFLLLGGEYCVVEGFCADIYAVPVTVDDIEGLQNPDLRAPLVVVPALNSSSGSGSGSGSASGSAGEQVPGPQPLLPVSLRDDDSDMQQEQQQQEQQQQGQQQQEQQQQQQQSRPFYFGPDGIAEEADLLFAPSDVLTPSEEGLTNSPSSFADVPMASSPFPGLSTNSISSVETSSSSAGASTVVTSSSLSSLSHLRTTFERIRFSNATRFNYTRSTHIPSASSSASSSTAAGSTVTNDISSNASAAAVVLQPRQEYFRVVVALLVLCRGELFLVASRMSDPLVVRGQNPGRYNAASAASKKMPASKSASQKSKRAKKPRTASKTSSGASTNAENRPTDASNLISDVRPAESANGELDVTCVDESASSASQHDERARTDELPPSHKKRRRGHGTASDSLPSTLGEAAEEENVAPWNFARVSELDGPQHGALWVPNHVRIGIGTSNPQAALHVAGDVLVTGDIHKPSDARIKHNIAPVDGHKSLRTISQLQVKEYDVDSFEASDGAAGEQSDTDSRARPPRSVRRERGVIAQELQEILPYAVSTLPGKFRLPDGRTVQNLLVVNERSLLFENVSATQQLHRLLERDEHSLRALDDRFQSFESDQVMFRQNQDSVTRHTMQAYASATNQLNKLIDYVIDQEELEQQEMVRRPDRADDSCLYLSCCGLGPSWTIWILGFYFPPLWLLGILFLASPVSARRKGGMANLISCISYVFYWTGCFLIGRFVDPTITLGLGGTFHIFYWILGVACVATLSLRRRKRAQMYEEFRVAQRQELLEQRKGKIAGSSAHVMTLIEDNSDGDTSSCAATTSTFSGEV